MECYSPIKKNEIILFSSKRMEVEIIMLNKVSQNVTCFVSFVEIGQKQLYTQIQT
jgi:hypothetical protein